MTKFLNAIIDDVVLRRSPTGPASGRPEDRLRDRLEGRNADDAEPK
jgi:hypothetical protein